MDRSEQVAEGTSMAVAIVPADAPRSDDDDRPGFHQSASDEKYLQRAMMVREAELRAEHQQQARAMMIDLAKTVEELNTNNKELSASLRKEVQHGNDLEAKCIRLQKELQDERFAEECRQSERIKERGLQTKGMVFSMLLETSRDVYQPELFPRPKPPPPVEETDEQDSPSQQQEQQQQQQPQVLKERRLQPRLLLPSQLDKMKPREALKRISKRVAGPGDWVTFRLMVRLWRHEVVKSKRQQAIDEAERLRQAELQDRERIISEEVERRVSEFRNHLSELELHIDKLNEEKKEKDKHIQDLMERLEQTLEQGREKERRHQEEVRQLHLEIKSLKLQLDEAESKSNSMSMHHEETERELRKDIAAKEADIKKLRESILNLECDLAHALVLAKHLKDTAMKAKRDAAMSVSPKKFAMLIADLEEMKDRLTRLGREYNREKTSGEALKAELERRQRQLELERQFLPFLHVTRGPLGHKASGSHGAAPRKNKHPDAGWEVPSSPTNVATGGGENSPTTQRNTQSSRLRGTQSTGALVSTSKGGRPLGASV